jgi:hypothetical protein
MAIRWTDIQNISVTETEINLLAGLTASSADINAIAGFTGTVADLNNLIGTDTDLAAHEALSGLAAHTFALGSIAGNLLTDNSVPEAKLSFDVATQAELDVVSGNLATTDSNLATETARIDTLYGIVIPGQGSDIADAIAQTIAHIDAVANAHDASAISYGNYYALPSDIVAATTTSFTLPFSQLKHFRAGESMSIEDDVTAPETVVISSVNYSTGVVTFPVTTNGYTTANNGIIYVLSEDNVQEAVDRSFRNDGETNLVLREGLFKISISPATLSADRTISIRNENNILGNPSLSGNALSVLRVNAGQSDVEWHDITAADIDYTNTTSGLAATDVQAAIDEVDGDLDAHIADATIHFTEASINHLNIQNIGTNSHAQIDTHIADATLHRIINDAGTSTTELWSANKINNELTTHTHALDNLSDVDITGRGTASILEWNGTDTWIIGVKGEINTASNLGAGEGVYSTKVGDDLRFKSLVGGTDTSLTSDANTITINSDITLSNIGTGSDVYKQKTVSDFELRSITAGSGISVTQNANDIQISSTEGIGTQINKNQTAHGFAVLDAIYHNGTIWTKAQADSADTLAEFVVTEVTDVDNFVANRFGELTVASHGLTVGEHYFLSDTVAGGNRVTEPSEFSSPLFYIEDANTVHLEVYRPSEVTETTADGQDPFERHIQYLAASNWKAGTSANDYTWNAVIHSGGSGQYVAVASSGVTNRVMTAGSAGETWIQRAAAEDNTWNDVVYDGTGTYVAVSSDGTNRVMSSSDGQTWTARAHSVANAWRGVAYGAGLFVAVSDTGTGDRVMTSPNGTTWTTRTSSDDSDWQAITFANGLFVAVADLGTNRVMTSPNGIDWTSRTAAAANSWSCITYGDGLYVAGAVGGTDKIMTSPNGIDWTSRQCGIVVRGLAYANGVFVAVGDSSMAISKDGVNWARVPVSSEVNNNLMNAVCHGEGHFVAVCSSGTGNRVTYNQYLELQNFD